MAGATTLGFALKQSGAWRHPPGAPWLIAGAAVRDTVRWHPKITGKAGAGERALLAPAGAFETGNVITSKGGMFAASAMRTLAPHAKA